MLCVIGCTQNKTLVFEDEFEGETLNLTYWNYELGDGCPKLCGWGNNELQQYTKENIRVENGYLIITATKGEDSYFSGRITTKGKKEIQYGSIEVKAKLATGKGIWSAFWMLGENIDTRAWPACGEIDILEYVGKEPNVIFTSLHTPDSFGETIHTMKTKIVGIEDGFHVYKADWNKDSIVFSIDGNKVYTFNPSIKNKETWPFDQPFYAILNLAIGGNFGGSEVDDSIFPQEFVIDYVRFYNN